MAAKIKNGQTILFIGDSITEMGRGDVERPLGNGYVKLFSDFLTVRRPGKKVNIINRGIGGNTVRDLQNRWSDDVLFYKPDWLSVKIGINDLHSFLTKTPKSVSPEEFFTIYDDILSRTKKRLPQCKILLIDPFYISIEKSKSSFRKDVLDILGRYIETVHRMSRKYKTHLVKTHDIFQKLLKYNNTDTFCPEPIHPYLIGHIVIAEAVYKILSA